MERASTPAVAVSVLSKRNAVLLIIVSSLLISVNGFMLRSIDSANEWQVIFCRQVFFTSAILLLLTLQYRSQLLRSFLRVGWPGIGAGIALGLANPLIILAMTHTTVANALFTLSASPLITAVLAKIFLRESLARTTLVAIAVAMAGITIMVADGLGGGSVLGNLLALLCALFFSLFVIFLRLGKERNMLPACVLGGIISASIGLIGADFDYHLELHDGLICLLWGGIIVTIVHYLFTQASRYVAGAEIMLITLIEFTLGPIWVWLGFGERPTTVAIAGGTLVLGAVAGRALMLMRQTTSP